MVVEEQPAVRRGLVGDRDDVARAAELEQDVAGFGETGGKRGGDVVGGAAEYQQLSCKPVAAAASLGTSPTVLMRGDELRDRLSRQAGQRDQVRLQLSGRRDRRNPPPEPQLRSTVSRPVRR